MSKGIDLFKEKLSKLRQEAKFDGQKIQKDKLDEEFKISELVTKWIFYRIDFSQTFNIADRNRKKKYIKLKVFYEEDTNMRLTKEQLENLIATDLTYEELEVKCQILIEMIKLCEDMKKVLENKQWETKNYIDYIKWKKGLVE